MRSGARASSATPRPQSPPSGQHPRPIALPPETAGQRHLRSPWTGPGDSFDGGHGTPAPCRHGREGPAPWCLEGSAPRCLRRPRRRRSMMVAAVEHDSRHGPRDTATAREEPGQPGRQQEQRNAHRDPAVRELSRGAGATTGTGSPTSLKRMSGSGPCDAIGNAPSIA